VYVAYFSLREPPFSIAPDPAYLYMSARHQEALGHLLYGTGQYGGFVQLTGEVGTGKTTIVRTLLAQKLDDVDVAMIHNPRQSEIEFIESICDELGVRYPHTGTATLKQRVDALNAHLLQVHAAGRRTVLIIDEAQNLSPQVLEQVRLLTNLETDKEKLLRIMLVGQPELAELLARPDLRQLASRITARYHLLPLSEAETREYISHRLRVAGGSVDIIPAAAARAIHRHAGGIPRQVNIICDRALLGAYAQKLRQVTPAVVDHAAVEALGPAAARSVLKRLRLPRVPLLWVEGVLACGGLILAGVLLQSAFSGVSTPSEPSATAVTRPAPAAAPISTLAADSSATLPAIPVSSSGATDDSLRSGDGVRSGLGPILEHPESVGTLMGRLITLWNPQIKIAAGDNVCNTLDQSQLECYRGHGHWTDLDQMNRPAIITLSLGRDQKQYVLLRRLGDNNAVLDTADGPYKVPLSQLSAAWDGEFLLLWRNTSGSSRIQQSSHGQPVRWLRRKLALAAGNAPPDHPASSFDAALREQLMRYQRRNNLQVDGIAGLQTLLSLSAVGSTVPTPTLHPAD